MKIATRLGIPLLLLAVMVVLILARNRQEGHVTILSGNSARQAVTIVPGKYQGAQCGMTINQVVDSAQAVAPDGRTWFFDDVGCLALWLKDNRLRDEMMLWAYSRDTSEWVDARQCWYSRTDETPMGYGFAAYSVSGEGRVDFHRMVNFMQRDEHLNNSSTRDELLGNH
jgi:copper chaperone NosL